jgi:UDP-N-acetylmuramyl-tripeptide synthetase
VIARGIRRCDGVAGRFERVNEAGDDITVVVDYAHTPDALVNVLNTIGDVQKKKNGKRGRVITVMGCGGDRDRTKRPIMGEESARLSDLVIATSDNPRSEDPLLILNDIRVGLGRVGKPYELIVDRRQAIQRAIAQAKPGDVVLIAGKGHETYQILSTGKIYFDDREVAREALKARSAESGMRHPLAKRAASKRKQEALPPADRQHSSGEASSGASSSRASGQGGRGTGSGPGPGADSRPNSQEEE